MGMNKKGNCKEMRLERNFELKYAHFIEI